MKLFNNIFNYGIKEYDILSKEISECKGNTEIEKIKLLIKSDKYLKFLSNSLNIKKENIIIYLNEYANEKDFHRIFSKKLLEIS